MKPFPEPVYVTRPLLPPLSAIMKRLEHVWVTQWLTNSGPQHDELCAALRRYLQVEQVSLFNNGTIALMCAIRALDLSGEVVTTPFTFPATPHVLAWNGITPVFADIDPTRLTLDPDRVEERITPRTTAILGVHVYGVPCDVDALATVAAKHRLRLLYDGAHAFGVRVGEAGIGAYGDATMFSFHATKLFHTGEGGAIACADASLRHRIDRLKNFGIADQETVECVGINGKMSELQAALGLAVLECMEVETTRRRAILSIYEQRLGLLPGITLVPQLPGVESSYQYCAVRIDAREFGVSRDEVQRRLKTFNVFARKYFYPLCSDYPAYRDQPSANPSCLPVAQAVASQVLCLPLYGALDDDAVHAICDMVQSTQPVRI